MHIPRASSLEEKCVKKKKKKSPRHLDKAGVSHNIGSSGIFVGLAACIEWTSSL